MYLTKDGFYDLVVNDCVDVYNLETGEYVFCYNEDGAIAVYKLTQSEARELADQASETEESWSAFLGPGGYVYDDPWIYILDDLCKIGWIRCKEVNANG